MVAGLQEERFALAGIFCFSSTGPATEYTYVSTACDCQSVRGIRKLQALVYDILPLEEEEGAGERCSECGASGQ